jgi:hypothetical protein
VGAPFFCDREDELKLIMNRMRSGIHVFLLSPRRYGKSSLLDRASARLQKEGGRCASVNLLLCTNEAELASAILSAVVHSVLSGPGRARHSLEDMLRRIRIAPHVIFDPYGKTSVTFALAQSKQDWIGVLQDTIALLEDASEKGATALILDEFQVVASIGPRGVGGVFKALADQAKHTSIVFSGSHLSVMENLTRGKGAPLYGMGERLVLDVVPEEAMTKYLVRRAKVAGKRMSPSTARLIYDRADGIPNYVQQLALAAFEESDGEITEVEVILGSDRIVDAQVNDFAERLERLAPSQQRVLRALAETPTSAVSTKSFLDTIGVANHNAIQTALKALVKRELVYQTGRVWSVSDPFLRSWLRRPMN